LLSTAQSTLDFLSLALIFPGLGFSSLFRPNTLDALLSFAVEFFSPFFASSLFSGHLSAAPPALPRAQKGAEQKYKASSVH
jgi:hypothetical protein